MMGENNSALSTKMRITLLYVALMKKEKVIDTQIYGFEITDKQIEIFARRLMPEIKRYLADEDVRREFEEWLRERQKSA